MDQKQRVRGWLVKRRLVKRMMLTRADFNNTMTYSVLTTVKSIVIGIVRK